MFDLDYSGPGHFCEVRVNETLTLLFDNQKHVSPGHYAFVVSEDQFESILGRVRAAQVPFGATPGNPTDGEINRRRGGRGVYFTGGPDDHLWEIMTTQETGS